MTWRGRAKVLWGKVLASEVTHIAKWPRTWGVLLLGMLSLSCPHRRDTQKVALDAQGHTRCWLGHCRCCHYTIVSIPSVDCWTCPSAFRTTRSELRSEVSLQLKNHNYMRRYAWAIRGTEFGAELACVWVLAPSSISLPLPTAWLIPRLEPPPTPGILRLKSIYSINRFCNLTFILMIQGLCTFFCKPFLKSFSFGITRWKII